VHDWHIRHHKEMPQEHNTSTTSGRKPSDQCNKDTNMGKKQNKGNVGKVKHFINGMTCG